MKPSVTFRPDASTPREAGCGAAGIDFEPGFAIICHVTIHEFQARIERVYLAKDRRRGVDGTFRWFTEEVGELARGIRHKDRTELSAEFADVLAWLASLASQLGVDLEAAAAAKYERGCPKCLRTPCVCSETRSVRVKAGQRARRRQGPGV